MKVPTRLQPHQFAEFFDADTVDRINQVVWGKNSTFVATALNGKSYWVSYKFKDFHNRYLLTKVAKPVPGKPGYFFA